MVNFTESYVMENGLPQRKKLLYLAGKMRGIPLFNFPMFDTYAKALREAGFAVISPAEVDRANGFDEHHTDEKDITRKIMTRFMVRDIEAISECDGVAVMPGWEDSTGVKTEIAFAAFIGIPVYYLEKL